MGRCLLRLRFAFGQPRTLSAFVLNLKIPDGKRTTSRSPNTGLVATPGTTSPNLFTHSGLQHHLLARYVDKAAWPLVLENFLCSSSWTWATTLPIREIRRGHMFSLRFVTVCLILKYGSYKVYIVSQVNNESCQSQQASCEFILSTYGIWPDITLSGLR